MSRRSRGAMRKLNMDLVLEMNRQCRLIYACTGVALKRAYHWEKQGIVRLMGMTAQVWDECGEISTKSMIQMLDEETGVEVQRGDGRSWRELAFLNAGMSIGRLTEGQLMYMRVQQKKWMAPQVTACILLALHRKCGFDADQIAETYSRILEVEQECGFDEARAQELCREETSVNITDHVAGGW